MVLVRRAGVAGATSGSTAPRWLARVAARGDVRHHAGMDDRSADDEQRDLDEAFRRANGEQRGWWVHGVALAVIAVCFLAVSCEPWTAPKGLERLGVMLLAIALLVHVGVSTIIVGLARRHRVVAAVVVHGLVWSVAIARYMEMQDKT